MKLGKSFRGPNEILLKLVVDRDFCSAILRRPKVAEESKGSGWSRFVCRFLVGIDFGGDDHAEEKIQSFSRRKARPRRRADMFSRRSRFNDF